MTSSNKSTARHIDLPYAANVFRGFVLQATYRIHDGRPVVYLFGRLQDGTTFVVRDNRQTPHFYVAAEHADKVRNARTAPCEIRSFSGEILARVEVTVPGEAPAVRDALHGLGIATYEADVRFAMRYLIDRQIRGGIQISGAPSPGADGRIYFDNPDTAPADVGLVPRVLSFDIETNPQTNELLAIAWYGCGLDEVVIVDPAGREMPPHAVGVATQREALARFCEAVKLADPDVLTGWNVIDFDLTFLQQVAQRERFDLQLGAVRGGMRIRAAEGYMASASATIPGRLVLDGIDLLRGAFVKMDDYSLGAVANQVLGEGKTLPGKGSDKVDQILETYARALPEFALYARTDARLALQIAQRLNLFELAFARSRLTGMPADRVAASIASFDFLYLGELQRRGLAAPSVRRPGAGRIAQGGGAVFEPRVGIHDNVWVCDFRSLYPSIIRTFNIDPLGYALAQGGAPAIATQDGTRFARQQGILPAMLDTLFPQRARARALGDDIGSQAIKILMNSFYGVLGTPACRFYNPHIANAITSQGRYLLSWSRQWFEQRGYRVLYGDTDSVFVASGCNDAATAAALIDALVEDFNAQLAQHLRDRFDVVSRLELEFEKLYTRLFLANVRGGGQGARKRYAGLRYGQEQIEFVGMEVVRRDWTELAKRIQRGLFERLFNGEEVAHYLSSEVALLRAGELDHLLVYRKGLRKRVSDYTTNIPPHVQAVKKSRAPPPAVVSYVMTEAGPELVSEQSSPLDRTHYVERQIRPVAEPVLETLGLSFSRVIGDDRQIDLFG